MKVSFHIHIDVIFSLSSFQEVQYNKFETELKLLEMEKVLASREEDEIKLRHEETKKLKDSWNESMNAKLAERSASKESKNVPIHTSLSGAQPMAGEDLEQNQRVKFQQAQMRSNIAKSLGELDDAKKQQQLIELSYAQMDQYLYEMRTKAEIDEQNARRQTNIHIREENTQVNKYYYRNTLTHIKYIFTCLMKVRSS